MRGLRVNKKAHETQNEDPEDHIHEEGFDSMSHKNLVRKHILMLQAMKIPSAKAAVDKEGNKLKNLPARQESTAKCKEKDIEQAQKARQFILQRS